MNLHEFHRHSEYLQFHMPGFWRYCPTAIGNALAKDGILQWPTLPPIWSSWPLAAGRDMHCPNSLQGGQEQLPQASNPWLSTSLQLKRPGTMAPPRSKGDACQENASSNPFNVAFAPSCYFNMPKRALHWIDFLWEKGRKTLLLHTEASSSACSDLRCRQSRHQIFGPASSWSIHTSARFYFRLHLPQQRNPGAPTFQSLSPRKNASTKRIWALGSQNTASIPSHCASKKWAWSCFQKFLAWRTRWRPNLFRRNKVQFKSSDL